MTTLKEFEDALKEQGMNLALGILQGLRERDRDKRSASPARRISGRKMTAEVAREILQLHATTELTQQEIAFRLGVNQGRVNEVIKRGKWLTDDPAAPEAIALDQALRKMVRLKGPGAAMKARSNGRRKLVQPPPKVRQHRPAPQGQLTFGEI